MINEQGRYAIACDLLGEIDEDGYCKCPGADLHSGKSARKDCIVRLEGAPTIYCLHASCLSAVDEANRELRSKIGKMEATGEVEPVSREVILERRKRAREKDAKEAKEKAAREQASALLPVILRDWAWDTPAMMQESPASLLWEDGPEWATFLAGLYRHDDVVWIGGTCDTGAPHHTSHFLPVREWIRLKKPRGVLICPATFVGGSFSRCEASINERPYLVLEGDAVLPEIAVKAARGESLTEVEKYANQAACGAVINWLRRKTSLVLRAVVDSGSKSLHGWFDMPSPDDLATLKRLLPSLGFDPATLRPAQPVRLPGVMRPGARRWQRLLYLNLNPRNLL